MSGRRTVQGLCSHAWGRGVCPGLCQALPRHHRPQGSQSGQIWVAFRTHLPTLSWMPVGLSQEAGSLRGFPRGCCLCRAVAPSNPVSLSCAGGVGAPLWLVKEQTQG